MIAWCQIRLLVALALIAISSSAMFGFGSWQRALAGLSPDGVVTDLSWLSLRIILLALFAPGIIMAAPSMLSRPIARAHTVLQRLPVNTFLIFLLTAAVIMRIAVVLLLPLRLVSDFAYYDHLAVLWVSHGEYTDGTHPTSYFPPGWPFFLSRLYMVFGHHPHIGIVANIAFGAAVVLFIWLLIRRFWGEAPARWAALIVALMPNGLLFTNVLGSEGLFTFLLFASLLLLMPLPRGRSKFGVSHFIGGVLLGAATLTRTLGLLLPVVLLAVYGIYYGMTARAAARWLACVAGVLVVTVPWIMRNEARLGRMAISTNSGVDFLIGNNTNAGVGFNHPSDSPLLQRTAADEARDDSLGFALGVKYIREHPFAFLVRGLLKSTYFLACDTDAIWPDIAAAAERGVFDRYCWLGLGTEVVWLAFLIAVAAGILYFLRGSPWRDAGGLLFLGVILYWIAVHFVFFGGGRFHMPIVPVMAAFAGLALTRLSGPATSS